MINSISSKNIYLKPQKSYGNQNLPQNNFAAEISAKNNFVYPSAENFKAIAFGSKNNSSFLIYKGQKLYPDGKITENKSNAYAEIFEKSLKNKLDENEQKTFTQFFIERNNSVDDKYFIGLNTLSNKLHKVMMELPPEDKTEKPVIKHLKYEIYSNENYKKIKDQSPLVYKDKLYFPDGQITEEKRKKYQEILPEIKEGFYEEHADLFKKFFIDGEKLSFEELKSLQYIRSKDCNNLKNQGIENYLRKEVVRTEDYKNEKIKDEEKWSKVDEVYDKHDYGKAYELIKPVTPEDEEEFCENISRRAGYDLGTYISLPPETFGAKFHIALIERLQLLKELNQPLPPSIESYREPVKWNEDHTGFTSNMAHISYETNSDGSFESINHLGFNIDHIEASRELKIPEQKLIDQFIGNLNHEMGHLAHFTKEPEKSKQGFEA